MTPEETIAAILQVSEGMSRAVYRGQEDANWEPLSGAVRRLSRPEAHDVDVLSDEGRLWNLVDRYHEDHLVAQMEVIDSKLSNLQRLAVLQHYGAATGLLDFTESALVALWFACYRAPDKDGKVFTFDLNKTAKDGRAEERAGEDPWQACKGVTVYYEPDQQLGARIGPQQSVFVLCNPLMPKTYKTLEVHKADKAPILQHLRRLGISRERLFADVPGLAAANTVESPLIAVTPGEHRHRGIRYYQRGKYAEALAEYRAYAEARRETAEPHGLVGDTLDALGRHDEAAQAYARAIDNIDRPAQFGEQVVADPALGQFMLPTLYYNRGNTRAAGRDHRGAIADFDDALRSGSPHRRNVLYNRGNSKFALGMFDEAYEDFAAASSLREGSDAALAMGNCMVKAGKFEEAMRLYKRGGDGQPVNPAAHCSQNAAQLDQLLKLLDGQPYTREGLTLYLEGAARSRHWHFRSGLFKSP